MKRAPSLPSVALRLRSVGRAAARSASIETPSKRSASSCCLAAAIWPSTPSATAPLHEAVEHPIGAAGLERVARRVSTFPQMCCPARGQQQRGGIEDDNILFRSTGRAGHERLEPRGIFLDVAAGDDVERGAL